ncbi:hypothetical protein [Lysinibacillus odysseyi]|uniref:Uncharacterized protein n=1 Tax=Lysinibacillus odysseyi 34hs-1 = NBRC 100172 TaxID=1220589 RepID=A0A0A3IRM4_9BACI|nr:hypothetical protein [Lysinibacillus odysseyi]KGR87414.1 hypothetical protein CD32_03715 [Lysinibacillus odysseyi 34hs-1 = NBRC 100172]
MKKPWYKRWRMWVYVFAALAIFGLIMPDAREEAEPATTEVPRYTQTKSEAELAAEKVAAARAKAEKANEEHAAAKAVEVQPVSTTTGKKENKPVAQLIQLKKGAVLAKFTIDGNIGPYIDGTFVFTGNRTDIADYYALADTDHYRNASVIFKDDEIARVKFIPEGGTDPAVFLAEFGIYDEPRKLSGAAGYYEVALIPMYWSQNIEKYPFELD